MEAIFIRTSHHEQVLNRQVVRKDRLCWILDGWTRLVMLPSRSMVFVTDCKRGL